MNKVAYWEVEYKDFVPDVVFKFRKMTSLDVLDLAERNIGKNGDTKEFKRDCLQNVLWSRGGDWFALMDDAGNATLPELSASTLLDIFFKFRNEVCLPVFTESKTYRLLTDRATEDQVEKHV